MVALGSLTALTDLSLTVAPDKPSTKPFTINLCVLSTLKKLKVSISLDILHTHAHTDAGAMRVNPSSCTHIRVCVCMDVCARPLSRLGRTRTML